MHIDNTVTNSSNRLFMGLSQRQIALYLSLGLSLTFAGAARADRYVWSDSPYPGEPYDAWTNAAHDVH